MAHARRTYLPAAGHDWTLPLYDPIVKLMGLDKSRRTLLTQAAIPPGARVLDVGCGTGTLIALMATLHPGIDIVGIDPDPKALARAARKVLPGSPSVRLDRGFSDALPYADGSFDRVFSSFMFHHVPANDKPGSLREIRRVLKPGGSLHLVDFARPAPGTASHVTRWLHASDHFGDNDECRVLELLGQAGFADARVVERSSAVLLLRTAYYKASAPGGGGR